MTMETAVEKAEKEVECLSCHKAVTVVLVEHGFDGHIAPCPKCGELAYNEPGKDPTKSPKV